MAKKRAPSKTTVALPKCNAWVVRLDSSNRIDIPLALVDQVDWLHNAKASETSISVAVMPLDELAGVEVAPISEDGLAKRINELDDRGQLSEFERQQLQRLLDSRWVVNIEVRKTKPYRMPLPKEIRKLKLLPEFPGVALIYARENRLELWTDSHWLENLLKSKSLLRDKLDEFFGEAVAVNKAT